MPLGAPKSAGGWTRLQGLALCIGMALLLAYLSLIPFRHVPLPFETALQRFADLPYLVLRATRRADLIANALMYVPLGVLLARLLVPYPRARFEIWAVLVSLVVGTGWSAVVEFAQLYFPGRTTSWNDIVASACGCVLGAAMWTRVGHRWHEWSTQVLQGGMRSRRAVLGSYVLLYVVLSFSPFDIVLSWTELVDHLNSRLAGLWLAQVGCGGMPCSLRLAIEAMLAAPIAIWWGLHRGRLSGFLNALAVGVAFGLTIEVMQLLVYSGVSQGGSAAARAVGFVVGAVVFERREQLRRVDLRRHGRILVMLGALPYFASVAFVSGWLSGGYFSPSEAWARVGGIKWLPFYYIYFTTEYNAIYSTIVQTLLYAPVGVAVWLWGRRTNSASGPAAVVLAAAIAFVAESGKLFVKGKHPDYTDVLFAVAAAWTAVTLLRWASSAERADAAAEHAQPARRWTPERRDAPLPKARAPERKQSSSSMATASADVPFVTSPSPSWGVRAAAATVLLVVALSLMRFPVWQVPLAAGLAVYAWLLTRRPLAYLLVVPVALPVLDLAPLSGRFFWDEFDFLLATTIGVRLMMAAPRLRALPSLPKVGLSLLALSVLVSTVIGVWPLTWFDANAFTSYLSPYNPLRVAKGYLWGGVLMWLLWRDAAAGRAASSHLQLGLGLGLLAAALGVFWERLVFVGLTDFGAWFRAAGLVSATHVGGAYLEATLVVLTPFVLAQAVTARRAAVGALWFGVALLGAAALLMTLSRAAAAAWLISVAVFGALWWFGSRRRGAEELRGAWRWTALAGTVVLVAAAALMAQSTYLRDRLAMSGADFPTRLSHWRLTVDLMRGDPLHAVFGMGIGSFPREFYLAEASAQQLPAYRLDREPGGGAAFLALSGGQGMYLDQRVEAVPGRDLRLSGQLRSSVDGATVSIALCEKSFLTSVRCDWASVEASAAWKPIEVLLKLSDAPGARAGPQAPVSLSLYNSAFGTRVDFAGLSLLDGSTELLANGSFGNGLDRWLMYSDQHLAWRAKSTPLQVVFEQGMFGALAWLTLFVAVIRIASRRIGEPPVAAALAATVGFLLVGCFDTLLDSPRLTALAALVVALAVIPSERR